MCLYICLQQPDDSDRFHPISSQKDYAARGEKIANKCFAAAGFEDRAKGHSVFFSSSC